MRGLGLASAGITGAAIARQVPSAPSDARARVKHHLSELQKALGEQWPTMRVTVSTRYEQGLPALVLSVHLPE
jgi:hypothetical protein